MSIRSKTVDPVAFRHLRRKILALKRARDELADMLDLRYEEDPWRRERENIRIAELRKVGE